jgi:hypothetical protein
MVQVQQVDQEPMGMVTGHQIPVELVQMVDPVPVRVQMVHPILGL